MIISAAFSMIWPREQSLKLSELLIMFMQSHCCNFHAMFYAVKSHIAIS